MAETIKGNQQITEVLVNAKELIGQRFRSVAVNEQPTANTECLELLKALDLVQDAIDHLIRADRVRK